MEMCENADCVTTDPAYRFETSTAVDAHCEMETGSLCTVADGSAFYVGNFSLESCQETQSRTRWAALEGSEGAACRSEAQSRSRLVELTGAREWSTWTGTNQYSSCTTTSAVIIETEIYKVSLYRACDGSALGADVCIATQRVDVSVNNGDWVLGRVFKDECAGEPHQEFTADPGLCSQEVRYVSPLVDVADG